MIFYTIQINNEVYVFSSQSTAKLFYNLAKEHNIKGTASPIFHNLKSNTRIKQYKEREVNQMIELKNLCQLFKIDYEILDRI